MTDHKPPSNKFMLAKANIFDVPWCLVDNPTRQMWDITNVDKPRGERLETEGELTLGTVKSHEVGLYILQLHFDRITRGSMEIFEGEPIEQFAVRLYEFLQEHKIAQQTEEP